MNPAEDSCVGSDTERQREDGNERERRRISHRTQAVRKVLGGLLEPSPAPVSRVCSSTAAEESL